MSITARRTARLKERVAYERDYYGWIEHNVNSIRAGRHDDVDWMNVAEELEDIGKNEKRALRSQLARLLTHLLKWSHQLQRRRSSEHSWRATIEHARNTVLELLDENSSLKPQLRELLPAAYRDALAQVGSETNLPKERFPAKCPWSLAQALDHGFWPEG